MADGQFHSEEEISRSLGIPCSIVPDTLYRLLTPAINLEKSNKKGYRIPAGLELLNKKLILNELAHTKKLLDRLEILTSIDSTNTYLLDKKENAKTVAVFAEQQTAGRGQFNRKWISAIGKNITVSILQHFPNEANKLVGLSLVMGLAVVQALEEYGLNGVKLKWPNDVVYQSKKLAGILIETKASTEDYKLVIGIGLNLYKPSHFVDQAITDIYSIVKQPLQRNRIAGLLLKKVLLAISHFQANGFSFFYDEFCRLDNFKDKFISIKTEKDSLEGIARGVNLSAQLCVDIKGKRYCFNSGEVSFKSA